MRKLLIALAVVLVVAGGLVFWGSRYATSMVQDQLAAQKITFPPKAQLEKENPALAKYGGQLVDSGEEAKAYSDYIAGHLQKVANGRTYSEVSGDYQKDKTNQTLAGQRQTLFMGETLRGLLLNAWGWGLIGTIALYSSLVIFAAAAVVLAVLAMPVAAPASSKKTAKTRKK